MLLISHIFYEMLSFNVNSVCRWAGERHYSPAVNLALPLVFGKLQNA